MLCVALFGLRVERLWLSRPGLRGLPLAIYEAKGNHEIVVAVSPEARADGVLPGLTLTQGRARCPQLRAEPVSDEADRRALEQAAEALLAVSPVVALDPPDALYADIADSVHLFGGDEQVCTEALRVLFDIGHEGRAAVADGPAVAWAIARALCGQDKSPSHVVPPGEGARALAPLPLALLRLASQTVEQLRLVGVRSAGQLAALPRSSVLRRYGDPGDRAHQLASGRDEAPLEPFRPSEPIAERAELESPCEALEPLAFVLKGLLDRAQARMTGRGVAALRVELLLGLDPRGEHIEEVVLSRPLRASASLLTILRERLSNVRLEAPIGALELRVTETASFRGVQLDLLAPRETGSESLDELLARLLGAFGVGSVFAPALADRWKPEGAWARDAFDPDRAGSSDPKRRGKPRTGRPEGLLGLAAPAGQGAVARAGGLSAGAGLTAGVSAGGVAGQGDPGSSAAGACTGGVAGQSAVARRAGGQSAAPPEAPWIPPRPLALLPVPEPLSWDTRGGRGLVRAGRWEPVEELRGPERLAGEWWNERFDRDYWAVRLGGGARWWIYRDRRTGEWYLHGVFE